jgi:multidrug efflux pump subunit AcrA (membrane-fusion protein)
VTAQDETKLSENGNNPDAGVRMAEPPRRRSSLPILIMAVLFVTATFLTWYFTWFGRELSDADVSRYLSDETHPRHVQHALLQIQQRLERQDPTARQWYPRILELAANPEAEFRLTAAWAMGFDNKADEFHQTLLKLLRDNEPLVRRNAALALVRFNDPSGRNELVLTLRPYPVTAPVDGVVGSTLKEGSPVSRGTLLARIDRLDNAVVEVRSPLPGRINRISIADGTTVHSDNTILTIDSDAGSVWEALRGLALIGRAEDLREIERYAHGVDSLADRIKEQAALTAKAIQSREPQTDLKRP